MSSIFSKIIAGEIPCYKVAEDDKHLAFLDINPNTAGHTLCIPKQEVDRLMDLDQTAYQDLMLFSRNVALGLRKAVPCHRIGLSVIGLEVPHVHVHLLPLQSMADATFQNKASITAEEMQVLAQKIQEQIQLIEKTSSES